MKNYFFCCFAFAAIALSGCSSKSDGNVISIPVAPVSVATPMPTPLPRTWYTTQPAVQPESNYSNSQTSSNYSDKQTSATSTYSPPLAAPTRDTSSDYAAKQRMDRIEAEQEASKRDEAQRSHDDDVRRQQEEFNDRIRRNDQEASQRRIDMYEREKRDIVNSRDNSSSSDGWNRYRIETRDKKIENERRNMETR